MSVLFDGNGSNTTAAAAVLTALQASGGSLRGTRVLVLAATGPVGQRIARLLGRLGATVAIGSRDQGRATPWPAGCTRPRAPRSSHST